MAKTRLELRFDPELTERVKRLADDAGVSVNQLLQGLSQWAVDNAVRGEPYRDENGLVRVREQAGCIFFGRVAENRTPEEIDDLEAHYGRKWEPDKGSIVFVLDFTVRRVVRES
jgi:hypothetical protein